MLLSIRNEPNAPSTCGITSDSIHAGAEVIQLYTHKFSFYTFSRSHQKILEIF